MRILISGYYGFGNLGDEALLAGLSRSLLNAGHDVTVLSNSPATTRRDHGVAARHRLWETVPALLSCQALVSGGGGLLQDRTSSRSLGYYLGLLRLARTLGKRVVVFGQSLGPLSEAGWRRTSRDLAGVAVSVRDRPSQVLAAAHGIEAQLGADPALLLACPNPSAATGPVLFIPRHGYRSTTVALAEAARELAEGGARVACLALHPEQDQPEIELLQHTVPALELFTASGYQQALEHVAASSYVVSVRLHGLILASVCQRDHSGVNYDPKVAGFLADSGGRGFDIPVDPKALTEVLLARPRTPTVARSELKIRAEGSVTWLLEQLAD